MPDSADDALASSLTLIRQAKAGDAEALNRLLKRYSARVLQIVRLRLGPALREKLDSRDILQEAFLRAVKGFHRFEVRHEGAFVHWMSELVHNAIRDQHDYFHAAKRAARLERTPDAATGSDTRGPGTLPGPDPTPSSILTHREDFDRLVEALDRLTEESREAVIQRDMEGLSFAEIGKLLGRSEDAARMLYARAKSKLAGLMRASGR